MNGSPFLRDCAILAGLCLGLVGGCTEDRTVAASPRPTAVVEKDDSARGDRHGIADQMRTARAIPTAPADGGGRAWIEAGPAVVEVGSLASWTIIYEAGSKAVADGGTIVFMVSPFWGWSAPQTELPEAPGFTAITTDAEGVTLEPSAHVPPMLGITVTGRALEAGERIAINYGGRTGARTDRYAEKSSRFWIGVDGDGDGRHVFLADSPSVEVIAGPPRRMELIAPSAATLAEPVTVRLSILDAAGNSGGRFAGRITLVAVPDELEFPAQLQLTEDDRGTKAFPVTAHAAGVFRLAATTDTGLQAVSNPIVASEKARPIYWADLHGHTALSDGTGTPEQYFRYARDVAGLDIIALTDHDHWGVLHLDDTPALRQQIAEQTESFYQPGHFVTLHGYEWTSWVSGHRHVLYFDRGGPWLSSIDTAYDTPEELWSALRGKPAITVAHHSAGGPIATDWSIVPDPELEPITEVVSVHGVSEAPDAPGVIYSPVPGNFVRDALAKGYRFGFVGSGDSHDGHPGLAHIASPGTGGIAAVLADTLDRAAVLEAIRARRVYATSGPRIYLRTALDSHPMGASVAAASLATGEPPSLYVRAIGTAKIQSLDVVRSGSVTRHEIDHYEIETVLPFADVQPGEYVYVRIIQADGALAWSSPVFLE